MKYEKRLCKLAERIWSHGGRDRSGCRFWFSKSLTIDDKLVTYYDFAWKDRGHVAIMKLYSAPLNVGMSLRLVAKLQFFWNGYRFVLEDVTLSRRRK